MLITHLTAAACAAAAICLGRSEYEKKALSAEETTIYSSKVSKKRTFIFLSDLHENTFGQENEKLIQVIDQMHPDAVLNGGDLIVTKGTHAKTDRSLSLIKELVSRYPIYCGEGNHKAGRQLFKGLFQLSCFDPLISGSIYGCYVILHLHDVSPSFVSSIKNIIK